MCVCGGGGGGGRAREREREREKENEREREWGGGEVREGHVINNYYSRQRLIMLLFHNFSRLYIFK